MFRKICGDTATNNVVLVTSMWGKVSLDIGEAREKELSNNFFKAAIDKGAQMVRHDNTIESIHNIIRKIVPYRPISLRIQWELVDKGKDIAATAAGKAINKELNEQIRRNQIELKEVQEEMARALKEKDEEASQELEEAKRRVQERIEITRRDSERMAANYLAEKKRVEARMKEVEREVRMKEVEREAKRREQDAADRALRLQDEANRTLRLQDETDVPVTDGARLEQEVGGPQDLTEIPATILADDPANYDAPARTGEIERAEHYENPPPPLPPRTPSPQVTTLVASYVQVLFRLAAHGG